MLEKLVTDKETILYAVATLPDGRVATLMNGVVSIGYPVYDLANDKSIKEAKIDPDQPSPIFFSGEL